MTTAFPVPDGPIDLRQTSEQDLRRYGIPPRPNPTAEPEFARHWDKVFGREMELVQSGFGLWKTKRHRLGRRNRKMFNAGQSQYWCGSYFEDNTLTYQKISATWQISNEVAPATPGIGDYYCSAWIGIGGIDNSTIFQAGTEYEIIYDGTTWQPNVYFWYECYPGGECPCADLKVFPGNSVSVLLQQSGNATFTVSFTNNSTGKSCSTPTISTGDVVTVNSAQWIVERPKKGSVNGQLANFKPIQFTDMLMNTDGGQVFQGGNGTLMTMTADDKITTLAQPQRISDTSININYKGPA